MKKSKNEQVQNFLEEIRANDDDKFDILQALRKIVFSHYKKTDERMMYGGIMFSLEDDWGGIFVRKKHVSFEFVNGFAMSDPNQVLEGVGQYRRHLKIRNLADIENKDVTVFVNQAL